MAIYIRDFLPNSPFNQSVFKAAVTEPAITIFTHFKSLRADKTFNVRVAARTIIAEMIMT